MRMQRRAFLACAAAMAIGGASAARAQNGVEMYGLIGKMTAVPGKREELIAILLEGTSSMPGCLSYIVAKDPSDANAMWITEVWDSQTSHEASLSLPAVKDAIGKGRSLIAGFSHRVVTTPVGGHGLAASARG